MIQIKGLALWRTNPRSRRGLIVKPWAGADYSAFRRWQRAKVMAEWQAPGAVVVVIADGKVALARGYGVSSLETGEAVELKRSTCLSPRPWLGGGGSGSQDLFATAIWKAKNRHAARSPQQVITTVRQPKVKEL